MTARKTADAVPSEIPKAANVYQRLAIAKKLVAAHTFTKVKGEGLKFAYLPIDQVKPIVEDAMNEAGLVLLHGPVDTYDVRPSWVSQGQYGGSTTWFHLGGSQTFTWVNIDDPEDTIKVTFYGEARDNSDKTLSKLYTAILKNFYKATFNISDSPKDDTDNTEDEVRAEKAEARFHATKDGFFAPKVTVAKIAPKQDKAVVTDRPREVMVDTIIKANRRAAPRGIVTRYADKGGVDPTAWPDDIVADCYAAICAAMKEAEE